MNKLENYLNLPYGIALRKDEEGDWVARVEELAGCVAHGETAAKALERLEEAKRAWLEDAIEYGDRIPEPRPDESLPSGKWLQRVPRSLHKGLVEMAQKEGVSLNQLVTTVLAEALGRSRFGRTAFDIQPTADLTAWGKLDASWSVYLKDWESSGWQIEPHRPIEFLIDALGSPMLGIPDQINEPQFKVMERASKSKKELSYKS